jgi:hypothetical protein
VWRRTLAAKRRGFAALFQKAPKETRPCRFHPVHAATAAMGAREPGGGEASAWGGELNISILQLIY